MKPDKYDDRGRIIEMDGVPVRVMPPGFTVRYPVVDESEAPVLRWWARVGNKFTPVMKGGVLPSGTVVK